MESEREGEAEASADVRLTEAWDELGACPMTAADLDAAVMEIFESMLQTGCRVVPGCRGAGLRVRASIRLSGAGGGICMVELPVEAGDWLTDSLMGSEADWDEEMVNDAVGELCNMIAGGVKRRLHTAPEEWQMSLPVVWRGGGEGPGGEQVPGSHGMRRCYSMGAVTFAVRVAFWRA
ncbi:MAG: chemotaxis protein CheX [Acidobacteriota bacterium]|nr:chemotaxis protein CheX [Acidobacteriota bacterium]